MKNNEDMSDGSLLAALERLNNALRETGCLIYTTYFERIVTWLLQLIMKGIRRYEEKS